MWFEPVWLYNHIFGDNIYFFGWKNLYSCLTRGTRPGAPFWQSRFHAALAAQPTETALAWRDTQLACAAEGRARPDGCWVLGAAEPGLPALLAAIPHAFKMLLSQFWKCLTSLVLLLSSWKKLQAILSVLLNSNWKGLQSKETIIEMNHNFKSSVLSGLCSEAWYLQHFFDVYFSSWFRWEILWKLKIFCREFFT